MQPVSISPVRGKILLWRTLGFIFLIILITRMRWEDALQVFKTSHFSLFFLACFLEPLRFLVEAWRWKVILRFQKINYSLNTAFWVLLSSSYLGHITPGRIGNFIRGFYLSSEVKIPLGLSFSSVIWEKYLELSLTLIFGIWGGVVYLSGLNLAYIVSFSFFIIFLLYYLLYSQRMQNHLFRIVKKRFLKHRDIKIENFQKGLKLIGFKAFLIALGITVFSFIIFAFQGYLIALGLNLKINFFSFLSLFFLSKTISRIIPVSFSGWGSKDVFLILIFKNLGISAKSAFAFTILFLFSSYFVSLILGFLAWERKVLIWQRA